MVVFRCFWLVLSLGWSLVFCRMVLELLVLFEFQVFLGCL